MVKKLLHNITQVLNLHLDVKISTKSAMFFYLIKVEISEMLCFVHILFQIREKILYSKSLEYKERWNLYLYKCCFGNEYSV